MTPEHIAMRDQAARLRESMATLGRLWNLKRPLMAAELGRALRLGPSRADQAVRLWLSGQTQMPGPASVAIEMMELGALPPMGLDAVVSKKGIGDDRLS